MDRGDSGVWGSGRLFGRLAGGVSFGAETRCFAAGPAASGERTGRIEAAGHGESRGKAPGEGGKERPTVESVASTPESAPAASLTGIIGSRNRAALIESEGAQGMFRKGDSVFGAATVKRVGKTVLVLNANGREVRLFLPAVEAPAPPPPPEPAAAIARSTPIKGGELALVGILGGRSPAALIEYGGVEEMFRTGEEVFDRGRKGAPSRARRVR